MRGSMSTKQPTKANYEAAVVYITTYHSNQMCKYLPKHQPMNQIPNFGSV